VIKRTYWLEGGVLVGGAVGIWSGLSLASVCRNRTGCGLAGGAIGAFVGFVVGALVGGQVAKGGP
jgi:hypothetical protein